MPQDFDLSQFKATYFEECQDLLNEAEENLNILQTELENVDREVLNAVFRSVHSIKGGAGAFNYVELVEFSHIFEALLEKLRNGALDITEELCSVLLASIDVLTELVQLTQEEKTIPDILWKETATVLDKYGTVHSDKTENQLSDESDDEDQGWGLFIDEDELVANDSSEDDHSSLTVLHEAKPGYRIVFEPEKHLFRFANEPLLLVRELSTLGKCKAIVDVSKLPDLEELISDESYLYWTFELVSDRPLQDVEEVFEFVVDDCRLTIEKIEVNIGEEAVNQKEASPEPENENIPEKTIEKPVSKTEDRSEFSAVSRLTTLPEPSRPERPAVRNSTPAASLDAQSSLGPKISSIRVDLDRVDRLVNMVGELVITQAMLKQQAEDLPDKIGQVMSHGFETLNSHTRELQESVMAIRMQPVKSVFARMPRLVRELANKLDKKVDLITSGEMTEVDKTVIEQLMDPLTHMIRNSLDHGIETPQERRDAGKNEKASVQLNAEHRSGRIQIEVIDDGRGINREKVIQKAIQNGIVAPDHTLSDEDIDNLIFAPGFSTADEVSDVSGRGVGMDVVRRNVVSLGGRISVFSTPGKGTRFLMTLPLTLAVLDGMVVKCGDEKYIIPLTAVIESIHPMKEELQTLVNGGVLLSVRGEYIRLINLHSLFKIGNAVTEPHEALVVIVDTDRFGHVGIMVDDLLGQQQVVIKSLEENYDPVPGVSAATILGNGRVALILDIDGLADMEHEADKNKRLGKVEKTALKREQAYGIR